MNSEEFKDENPVDPTSLSIFKENIENNLLTILSSLPKLQKCLVLDKSCIQKLNFFTTLEKLRAENVRKELIILEPSTSIAHSSYYSIFNSP